MHEAGYKIIGVADIHGGLYNDKGSWRTETGGLGVRGAEAHCQNFRVAARSRPAQEVLFHPTEILVPGDRESNHFWECQLRGMQDFCARGRTSPTTSHADKIIEDKGIFIIPDILGNAAWGDG